MVLGVFNVIHDLLSSTRKGHCRDSEDSITLFDHCSMFLDGFLIDLSYVQVASDDPPSYHQSNICTNPLVQPYLTQFITRYHNRTAWRNLYHSSLIALP